MRIHINKFSGVYFSLLEALLNGVYSLSLYIKLWENLVVTTRD